jgi:hypothetical protein
MEITHLSNKLIMFRGGPLLLLVSLVRDTSNKTAASVCRPHRLETKMHCELTAEGKSGFAP